MQEFTAIENTIFFHNHFDYFFSRNYIVRVCYVNIKRLHESLFEIFRFTFLFTKQKFRHFEAGNKRSRIIFEVEHNFISLWRLYIQYFSSKTMSETVPKDLRQLRACLSCSLVKTFDQWENDGCENCDVFLHMKNNRDNVYDMTSSNFDGMVASMKPDDSWVCKWQRITKFKPGKNLFIKTIFSFLKLGKLSYIFLHFSGVYAISVSGRLPHNVVRDMQRSGVAHRSRDTSKR